MISSSCGVGQSAVLPCLVPSPESSPSPHIQWLSMSETVFERMGADQFQGQDYMGRVDVPVQMLKQGNCSLFLTDVQLTDTGLYHSYLVVGETKVKSKMLLQSIQFNVRDHKLKERVERGKHLVLELYTPQAGRVVFQRRRNSEEILWRRDEESLNPRVKHEGRRVVLREVGWEDEGTYRVLDEHGLALSTVIVTVTEPNPGQPEQTLQRREFTEGHSRGGRSCPVLALLLLCLIMHYLL